MIRTITDHRKHPHTLDLDAVLVDGVPCMGVQATEQYVQFELQTGEAVTCELGQFWQEVAGPDLSAQEAGLLLAECLIRQVVLQRTSTLLQEAMALFTRATALPAEIPSSIWLTTRLDPLSKQAMNAYDGTPAMTDMLARILQREPETVRAWARQLGLENAHFNALSASQAESTAAVQPPVEALPAEETEAKSRELFRWSDERLTQLHQAMQWYPVGPVTTRSQLIAERCGWPVEKVRSKLYELQRLAPRHAAQATSHEAETEKEGDQRVACEPVAVSGH